MSTLVVWVVDRQAEPLAAAKNTEWWRLVEGPFF